VGERPANHVRTSRSVFATMHHRTVRTEESHIAPSSFTRFTAGDRRVFCPKDQESRLFVRSTHFDRFPEVKRIFSSEPTFMFSSIEVAGPRIVGARRHMLAHRGVTPVRHRSQLRSNTLAVMEDLDGVMRPHGLAPQRMRHVIMGTPNNNDFFVELIADASLILAHNLSLVCSVWCARRPRGARRAHYSLYAAAIRSSVTSRRML
jgi:hypothetical protein